MIVFSDLIIRGRLSLFQFNLEIYTKYFTLPVSAAAANAILVTLGMGLLMQTIAGFVHFQPLYMAGTLAQDLLAPALGLAVPLS